MKDVATHGHYQPDPRLLTGAGYRGLGRRLAVGSISVDKLSSEIEVIAHEDASAVRLMRVPVHRLDHLQRHGGRNRYWRHLLQRDLTFPPGCPRAEADLHGDCTILGPISRGGNRYLRVLFVQAAWVALDRFEGLGAVRAQELDEVAKRRLHHKVLAIALANKLAHIAWRCWLGAANFELTRSNDLSPPTHLRLAPCSASSRRTRATPLAGLDRT